MNKAGFFLALALTLASTGSLGNSNDGKETIVEVVDMKNSLSLDGYVISVDDYYYDYQKEVIVDLPSSGYWSTSPHPDKKERPEYSPSITTNFRSIPPCEAHSKRCNIYIESTLSVPYEVGQKFINLYEYEYEYEYDSNSKEIRHVWKMVRKATIQLNPELIKELYKKREQKELYEKLEEAITTAFRFIIITIGLLVAYWLFNRNKKKFPIYISNISMVIRKIWNQAKSIKDNQSNKKIENIAAEEAIKQIARNEVNRAQEEESQLKQEIIDAISAGDMKKATELTQVLNSRFKREPQGLPTRNE